MIIMAHLPSLQHRHTFNQLQHSRHQTHSHLPISDRRNQVCLMNILSLITFYNLFLGLDYSCFFILKIQPLLVALVVCQTSSVKAPLGSRMFLFFAIVFFHRHFFLFLLSYCLSYMVPRNIL